jgi:hypothetical protein
MTTKFKGSDTPPAALAKGAGRVRRRAVLAGVMTGVFLVSTQSVPAAFALAADALFSGPAGSAVSNVSLTRGQPRQFQMMVPWGEGRGGPGVVDLGVVVIGAFGGSATQTYGCLVAPDLTFSQSMWSPLPFRLFVHDGVHLVTEADTLPKVRELSPCEFG